MALIRSFKQIEEWHPHRDVLREGLRLAPTRLADTEFLYCGLAAFSPKGEVLAACALYDNPYLLHCGEKATCFGYFDSRPEAEGAKQMLRAAAETAVAMGKKWLIGPMNGSTWGQYRLPVTGEGLKYVFDVESPAHYADILRETGLEAIGHYATRLDEGLCSDQARVQRAQQKLSPLELSIRKINTDRYEDELAGIHAFCMEAFADNVLFSPISLEGFLAKYLPLKAYIVPELVLLAENRQGQLKGFIFAVPNLLDTTSAGIVVKTIAIQKGREHAGLATMLGAQLYGNAAALGFGYALHAFMESHNKSVNLSAHFNGRTVKEYQLWGWDLSKG